MDDVLRRLKEALADRYTVEREIGRGGMSLVFLAQDLNNQRQVALKVLRPELTLSVGTERFLREIRIAANLQHPHILPLFDSGEGAGLLYYTMPYLTGESLDDRVKREGPLPVADALKIAHEVGDALAYAHAKGIVHRDIKPGNILLTSGHAVVADFGIARAITEAGGDTHTEPSIALGTVYYVSPEQASGQENIDGRSDLYALGCVLYEMLAGEPPFNGRTTQAIIAKQLSEKAPSVEVLRPGVPKHVVKVIETSLAKVAADRYGSAGEFVKALDTGGGKRPWGKIAFASAVILGLIWISQPAFQRQPPLDANRVTVFPLEEMGVAQLPADIGGIVGQLIASALEHTAPLKWLAGQPWLGDSDPRAAVADSIARRLRARYRVGGSIVERGDSADIILQLYDVEADSLVIQRTVSSKASVTSVIEVGIGAMRELIQPLIGPGRVVDLAAIEDCQVSAVALWMMGDNEYRRLRFDKALGFYDRALQSDSTMAMAALMGAQAASWLHRPEAVLTMLSAALRNDASLPARHRFFGHGLRFYQDGNADSAIANFRRALELDADWADAWMALAEVYHHLVLNMAAWDSAENAFARAAELDPEFSPALMHLAEHLLRSGPTNRAEQIVSRYREFASDSQYEFRLDLINGCVNQGGREIDWQEAAQRDLWAVVAAATFFSGSAFRLGCAEAAYRAVIESENAPINRRWGARLGLQSLLLAQGRYQELRWVLDSARMDLRGSTRALYLLDVVAGAPLNESASEVAAARCTVPTSQSNTPVLWLCSIWAAHVNDTALVLAIERVLNDRADSTGDRRDRLLAQIAAAYSALASGDSAEALTRFTDLSPTAPFGDLAWQPWESLAAERMQLARLLFASGRYLDADSVASLLDHPEPVVYLAFLRASFSLRASAADSIGDVALANTYRRRLEALRR